MKELEKIVKYKDIRYQDQDHLNSYIIQVPIQSYNHHVQVRKLNSKK